jgi:energy-coupling factor transporter ATP-binding protein EcfA2
VAIGDEEIYGSLRLGSLLSHSLIEINRRAAAAWTGPVLHAGAVVVDGCAIALCGRSGSGKTTLTAALGAAGYPMLADEVCALDVDNKVQPYGKPLAIRPPSIVALGNGLPARAVTRFEEDETFVALSSLAGGVGSAVPLAVVVFAEFAPDEPCTVVRMTPGECLVELMHHTLASGCSRGDSFAQLGRLAAGAGGWRLRSGDLAASVAAVAALAGGSRRTQTVKHVGHQVGHLGDVGAVGDDMPGVRKREGLHGAADGADHSEAGGRVDHLVELARDHGDGAGDGGEIRASDADVHRQDCSER